MEKEKLSFLKKLKISIFDFDGYQELAAEKISRTIGYIVLLILIFSAIVSLTYTLQFNGFIGNTKNYINNEISEIKYENYELSVIPNVKGKETDKNQAVGKENKNSEQKEKIEVEDEEQEKKNEQQKNDELQKNSEEKNNNKLENISKSENENQQANENSSENPNVMKIDSNELIPIKIIINTETTDEDVIKENINEIKLSQNGILILKDKVVIKNEFSTNLIEYTYKTLSEQYNINKIDKTEILNMLSGQALNRALIIFFITLLLYMLIMYVSTMLIDILLLVVLTYIVTRISGLRLKYSAIYNIASYSLTLPVILNMVYFVINRLTGFTIEYFQIMYTAIASIYIITAVLMIKSDVIKKQLELNKIIEEQEKVKQELLRKEEERKEQEEQERRRREKEKKEGNNKEDGRREKNLGKESQDGDNRREGEQSQGGEIGETPEGGNA